MTIHSIEALITVANTWIHNKVGKPLEPTQSNILTQVLEGKRVKDIRVTGYSPNTVKTRLTPALWKLLTHAFGQSVSSKTVYRILEQAAQGELDCPQFSSNVDPQEHLSAPSSSDPSPSDTPSLPLKSEILHNLPAPTYTEFIGRESELAKLLDHLSFDRPAHIISIDGTGGVGKTALAMEAAYCCLRGRFRNDNTGSVQISQRLTGITFDAIIFVSAKETYLTPIGLVRTHSPRRGLQDIFRQVALVLELDLAGLPFNDQMDTIKQALSKQLCWLIIDNLESLDGEQQEQILAFLFELPPTVKTVITTRKQIVFVPVRLSAMAEDDSLRLIEHEAQEKGVALSAYDQRKLHHVTGGVPIAIGFAVGMLANGALLDEVLEHLAQPTGEIAQFCFEHSVQALQGTAAYQMLMAFALFPASVSREILVSIATPNLDRDAIRNALLQLRGFSLIQATIQGRYQTLPLMREYAIALLKSHPDDEPILRNRWITWYVEQHSLNYCVQSIEDSFKLEQLDLSQLVEWPDEWMNLEAVIEQCMEEDRYDALVTLQRNTQDFISLIGRKATRTGYWGDRLRLLNWLIRAAEDRGDFPVLAKSLFDRAWMLTLLGKPQHLQEA